MQYRLQLRLIKRTWLRKVGGVTALPLAVKEETKQLYLHKSTPRQKTWIETVYLLMQMATYKTQAHSRKFTVGLQMGLDIEDTHFTLGTQLVVHFIRDLH